LSLSSELPSMRPRPACPLCPYTTLFRSRRTPPAVDDAGLHRQFLLGMPELHHGEKRHLREVRHMRGDERVLVVCRVSAAWHTSRSEEHTSELQSRENLVCRLLLEKRNRV